MGMMILNTIDYMIPITPMTPIFSLVSKPKAVGQPSSIIRPKPANVAAISIQVNSTMSFRTVLSPGSV